MEATNNAAVDDDPLIGTRSVTKSLWNNGDCNMEAFYGWLLDGKDLGPAGLIASEDMRQGEEEQEDQQPQTQWSKASATATVNLSGLGVDQAALPTRKRIRTDVPGLQSYGQPNSIQNYNIWGSQLSQTPVSTNKNGIPTNLMGLQNDPLLDKATKHKETPDEFKKKLDNQRQLYKDMQEEQAHKDIVDAIKPQATASSSKGSKKSSNKGAKAKKLMEGGSEENSIEIKRARNKRAAEKYRQKKKKEQESMNGMVSQLQHQALAYQSKIMALEKHIILLRSILRDNGIDAPTPTG